MKGNFPRTVTYDGYNRKVLESLPAYADALPFTLTARGGVDKPLLRLLNRQVSGSS